MLYQRRHAQALSEARMHLFRRLRAAFDGRSPVAGEDLSVRCQRGEGAIDQPVEVLRVEVVAQLAEHYQLERLAGPLVRQAALLHRGMAETEQPRLCQADGGLRGVTAQQ